MSGEITNYEWRKAFRESPEAEGHHASSADLEVAAADFILRTQCPLDAQDLILSYVYYQGID